MSESGRVLHEVGALRSGERRVSLKGLVPGVIDALGSDETESFFSELATKARRYEEVRTHSGEGHLWAHPLVTTVFVW
ncbi:MAG: hypothetical protein ABIT38_04595 [Gemmatimonadaceae bacterium]